MKQRLTVVLLVLISLMIFPNTVFACTSFIAGKNTTVDGSVISVHNEDLSANTCQVVQVIPAKKFKKNEVEYLGSGQPLPYVAETYKTIQFNSDCPVGVPKLDYNLANPNYLNEFGVCSWDDAMTPRTEFLTIENNNTQLVDSRELKSVPISRAKTAREAVQILGSLVDTFGFMQSGMCYGIADPQEGWIVEVLKGKHWVAQRVPDDMIVMRSNSLRIGNVDLSDTANFMGSSDLVSFAQAQGWYNPSSGPFNFCAAYASPSSMVAASNTYRERAGLSFFKPSAAATYDINNPATFYERGVGDGVVPDNKISIVDAMKFERQHYEGTDADLTQGYVKGSPHWTANRVICVDTTCSSSVIQLRSALGTLPADIANVLWRADATPCTSVYVPWYLGITEAPADFTTGEASNPDPSESAWWTYRLLNNQVDAHYMEFIPKVRGGVAAKALFGGDIVGFDKIESDLLANQAAFEAQALNIYQTKPNKLADALTNYSGAKALYALGQARQMLTRLTLESVVGSWKYITE